MDNSLTVVRDPLLPPSIEINTASIDSQSNCLLFTLPAELRQQIYEYVIGSGQIHVVIRSCTASQKPIRRISTTAVDLIMHDYQKLTYSTCRNPVSFKHRYHLSKRPADQIPVMYYNSRGHLPYFPGPETRSFIIPNWSMEHAFCYSSPQKDMVLQQYSSVKCEAANEYVRHDSRNCKGCAKARVQVERQFGPPTAEEGLKRYHQASAVTVNGLLRCCKRVYFESRLLPFSLYTFDVSANHLRDFATRWLESWQVAAIERVHVEVEAEMLGELADVVREVMKGLKVLEVAFENRKAGSLEVGGRELGVGVEKVEVVAGFDFDRRAGRIWRRGEAEKVEGLFLGGRQVNVETGNGRI